MRMNNKLIYTHESVTLEAASWGQPIQWILVQEEGHLHRFPEGETLVAQILQKVELQIIKEFQPIEVSQQVLYV